MSRWPNLLFSVTWQASPVLDSVEESLWLEADLSWAEAKVRIVDGRIWSAISFRRNLYGVEIDPGAWAQQQASRAFQRHISNQLRVVASDISWNGEGQFSYSWGDHRSWQERSPVRLPRKVQGLNGVNTRGRQKSTRTNFDRIVEGVSWQLYLALFLLEWLIPDKSYVRKNGFIAHGARMQATRGCSPPSRGREAAGV